MSLRVFLESVNVKVDNVKDLKKIDFCRGFIEIPEYKEEAIPAEKELFEELKEKYEEKALEFNFFGEWKRNFALDKKVKKFAESKDQGEKNIQEENQHTGETIIIINKKEIDGLIVALKNSNSGMISTLRNLKENFDFENNTLYYKSTY